MTAPDRPQVIWHVFPIVWLLSAFDWISVESEHHGYIAGDLVAKYLLLFVYTLSVSAHDSPKSSDSESHED